MLSLRGTLTSPLRGHVCYTSCSVARSSTVLLSQYHLNLTFEPWNVALNDVPYLLDTHPQVAVDHNVAKSGYASPVYAGLSRFERRRQSLGRLCQDMFAHMNGHLAHPALTGQDVAPGDSILIFLLSQER